MLLITFIGYIQNCYDYCDCEHLSTRVISLTEAYEAIAEYLL